MPQCERRGADASSVRCGARAGAGVVEEGQSCYRESFFMRRFNGQKRTERSGVSLGDAGRSGKVVAAVASCRVPVAGQGAVSRIQGCGEAAGVPGGRR